MDLRLTGRRTPARGTRRRIAAAVCALAVLAGAGTWTAVASDGPPAVHREDRMLTGGGVRLDTAFFTAGPAGRRPAVLLGHGFGGSKDDVRPEAETLARRGYAVLTWSARGFGRSTGKIGLNDPRGEVADVSRLVDWLARRPEVRLDGPGDPRVGAAGASYGGAVSLLAAAHDHRIDALAPEMTYWNLADALFPHDVLKKLWAGVFFTSGSADIGARPSAAGIGCGRFEPELCAMYQRVAESGKPDAAARKLLEERSPEHVGGAIKVPTLIAQGQTDSLFTLDQADAMARGIRANGAPVSVDWVSGGHDGGDTESGRITSRVGAWFDRYLKRDTSVGTGPAFRVSRTGGVDSTDGAALLRGASADRYPGLDSAVRSVPMKTATETFTNPPGGSPPAISGVPGIGDVSRLSGLGLGLSLDFPGQFARFDSAPLRRDLRVTGAPTATVRVTANHGDAVLFAKVYDVGPDGHSQVLPSQLVSPVRVPAAEARRGRDVRLTLPAVDHEVPKGHRLRLVLSSTDLGYASPAAPATYTATLTGPLRVPTAPGVTTGAPAVPSWVWWLPLAGLVLAAGLVLGGRRRGAAPPPDPALAGVPLEITGLSKRYARSADRYAVRDLSFRVEQGQVLGLLGPNGAGKTTTLRMLMGLIRPDEGDIRVFGHAVRPGAPVLSRIGCFVEGAGFLPHLSGRANLELYWAATGRPAADAHLDEALETAGLGDALERAVRTYSQGMRQRLALAQAMLGLPDLLILDEPTNGLDPPQIRAMRDVMIRYAAGGRTVIVSSHLLSEVEQSCTHLVVMDRGRLVRTGPTASIAGAADTLFVGLTHDIPDPLVEKIAALPGVRSATRADGGLLVRVAPWPDPEAGPGADPGADPGAESGADAGPGAESSAGAGSPGPAARRLLVELVRLDVPVRSLGAHRRLEDAFLTLIGGAA